MKVLVLGGTGAMGTHLVSILAEAGMKVDVTSRQELADRTNIHYIKGNVHNISFVKSLLAQNYYNVIIDFMIYTTVGYILIIPTSIFILVLHVFMQMRH